MAMNAPHLLDGRLLVVAFEGWNDAGEAASSAVRVLQELLELVPLHVFDSETFYDYQYVRPTIGFNDEGSRVLRWPTSTVFAPMVPGSTPIPLADDAELHVTGNNAGNIYLLQGIEPSRNWQTFASEVIDVCLAADISGVVLLGAMLADVPHTRPIHTFVSSENAHVRQQLDVERSSYEGPVGILSVVAMAAEAAGIPTVAIWASVPHYVHQGPSPKATLALIDKLEELVDVVIPRGDLVAEAAAWEAGVNKLASEDEDMTAYIAQLEQARDVADSPQASGESLAQEFERFLRDKERPDDDSGTESGTEPRG
jgi:outer membrane murein-binding lipoprotein Lpp